MKNILVSIFVFAVMGAASQGDALAAYCGTKSKPSINSRCKCQTGKLSGRYYGKKSGSTSTKKACRLAVNGSKNNAKKKYGKVVKYSHRVTRRRVHKKTFGSNTAECWIRYNLTYQKTKKSEVRKFLHRTIKTQKGTSKIIEYGYASFSKGCGRAASIGRSLCAKKGKVVSFNFRYTSRKKVKKALGRNWTRCEGRWTCKYKPFKPTRVYWCAP